MKTKSTLLSIALFLLITATKAQSWLTTGNRGTNPATNFLGTINKQVLAFRTNDIERMRISPNGKVGIGTTTPTQLLDVNGNINFDSALYLNNSKILYYQNGILNFGREGGVQIGGNDQTVDVGTPGQDATSLEVQGGDNAITAVGLISIYGFSDDTHNYGMPIGIYGKALAGIGLLAESDSSYGVSASTGNPDSYAGYFTGSVYSTGSYVGSDEKLKQNITDFSSALNIIKQLHPKQYEYKQDGDYKLMNLPQGEHYGLIAQDVEKILPGLVKNSNFNAAQSKQLNAIVNSKKPLSQSISSNQIISFKALNYNELIPVLIKGMQEQEGVIETQQQSIDELKRLNQQQQEQINQLMGLVQNATANSITANKSVLQQNVPNPFSNSTSISYTLPAKYSSAKIIMSDKNGNALKQVNLTGNGNGTIMVDASTLASGAYQYSLYIDGKLAETKQMLLTK